MELLLLDGTLLPPALLQLLVQQLSALNRRRLSTSLLRSAPFLPVLFSHHISVHGCVAEIQLQCCAGRQLPLTLAWPAAICLDVWKNFSLVLVIEIRFHLRLGLRGSSLWLGCRSLTAVELDEWDR